ncbi:glycosyltransferase [Paludibaculum fermentans]|uniref:Glycosyltransferase n=1 Tax=Paludibaculum fermentans TaxID=1473598 RepID=A0A7S7NLW5_PALFE|nr:glycosyltransferase [Paludibaculum fermentans]QOY86043.1 glycosyltransferase [Paludibaculum fermentans]
MKVAIVHDWSVGYAGSERVVEQLIALFPQADLHFVADFIPDAQRAFLAGKTPTTTFIQNLPWARRLVRHYLPLMPMAVETIDLSGYDVILSSSHAVAKGVLSAPGQIHICYCHTPLRYAWDLQHEYLREAGLTHGIRRAAAIGILHYLRLWDVRTAHGVDRFVANSNFIAGRIRRVYSRDSVVVYPPVDTEYYTLSDDKRSYYFTASRLVPYKRIGLLLDAFRQMPGRRLLVAGDGPDLDRYRRAAPTNVELLGPVPRSSLRQLMQHARAFVFAAEEDFGIVLAEAQACGTPAICYGRGGALDIVVDEQTGLFFRQPTAESLRETVGRFEARTARWDSHHIRRNALRFSIQSFRDNFLQVFHSATHAPEEECGPLQVGS